MFIFGSEFFFPLCRWFSLRERIQRDRNEERASPKLKRCYETRVYICMEPKAFLKCIFSWSISNVVDSTCFIHSFRFCVCVCVFGCSLLSLLFTHWKFYYCKLQCWFSSRLFSFLLLLCCYFLHFLNFVSIRFFLLCSSFYFIFSRVLCSFCLSLCCFT